MASAFCHTHSRVPALGICMGCGRSLCGDCTTKLDGINHCPDCLAALLAGAAAPDADVRPLVPTALSLSLGLCTLWLLSWSLLVALLPGSGGP